MQLSLGFKNFLEQTVFSSSRQTVYILFTATATVDYFEMVMNFTHRLKPIVL